MNNLPFNPTIYDPSNEYQISFRQTKESLLDTEVYKRFIYSAEQQVRRSQWYKDYKSHLMDLGMYRDQRHASITSEMTEIEMHHNWLTMFYMCIMITEHLLNVNGTVTTFEVARHIEEAHRNNEVCVIMLSTTEHQFHHANEGTDFISIRQCAGDPFKFIDKYIDGMTLDISFKLLLGLKQEEQYNGSYSPSEIRAREQILGWQNGYIIR